LPIQVVRKYPGRVMGNCGGKAERQGEFVYPPLLLPQTEADEELLAPEYWERLDRKQNGNSWVWEITLKSGYKLPDGTTVTAQHVADCLKAPLNEKNGGKRSSLGQIQVTALGAQKVRIESEWQVQLSTFDSPRE